MSIRNRIALMILQALEGSSDIKLSYHGSSVIFSVRKRELFPSAYHIIFPTSSIEINGIPSFVPIVYTVEVSEAIARTQEVTFIEATL